MGEVARRAAVAERRISRKIPSQSPCGDSSPKGGALNTSVCNLSTNSKKRNIDMLRLTIILQYCII